MKPIASVPSRTDQFIPPAIAVEEDTQRPSVFSGIALTCWLAGIFIIYSRFFDLALRGFYIPRVVLSLLMLFFLLSGRPLSFMRSTVGRIMVGFILWVTFTLIFSVWKGGSLPYYSALLQSLMYFAIAAGIPNTVSDVKKTLSALALSGLVAALMSIPWGEDSAGRLILRDGSYADPNYYAMGVVAVLPFFWEMAAAAKSKLVKIFALLAVMPIFLVFVKAGSRGAMLGFTVMVLLLLVISPLKTKIVLLLACALGFATVIATVPNYLKARYETLFSNSLAEQGGDAGNRDIDRLNGDVGSAEGRKMLLMQSIALTVEHPLVGVGPGNFPVAVYDEARAHGITRNQWLVTHNSYTQISCETGFPGLILLLAVIVGSFINIAIVLKGSKPTGEKPDPIAYSAAKPLLLSFTVICICVFFLAVGYDFTIYLWAGLTVALRRTYEQKRVAASLAIDEPDAQAKPAAVAPAYSKAPERFPETRTPTAVTGRRMRFNRLR